MAAKILTITDHSRSFANNTYVYPVLSRRSQGISLGINLNVNNACNWRCVYCQVEGLIRGKPVKLDLDALESELDDMLWQIVAGDFVQKFAPVGMQRFNDIAISGNGESTLAPEFLEVISIITKLYVKYNLAEMADPIKIVLITNGSEMERLQVLQALDIMAQYHGEVWFKVDRATADGIKQVNQVNLTLHSIKHKLMLCSQHCKTYIQTCMFQDHDISPNQDEINAYIGFIAEIKQYIKGVLLYTVARNPALPEGESITPLSLKFFQNIAKSLQQLNIAVQYYASEQ